MARGDILRSFVDLKRVRAPAPEARANGGDAPPAREAMSENPAAPVHAALAAPVETPPDDATPNDAAVSDATSSVGAAAAPNSAATDAPMPAPSAGSEGAVAASRAGRRIAYVTKPALDHLHDAAREAFVNFGDLSAAYRIGVHDFKPRGRLSKAPDGRWRIGVTPLGPIDEMIRSGAMKFAKLSDAAAADERAGAAPESPEVAAARKDWDEAARSGDPDRMTRTANALIRAVEKQRAERGEGPIPSREETGRDPIGDILAPQEAGRDNAAGKPQGANGAASIADGAYAKSHWDHGELSVDAFLPPGEAVSLDENGRPIVRAMSQADLPPGWTTDNRGDPRGAVGVPPKLTEEQAQAAADAIMKAPEEQRAEMLRQMREKFGEAMTAQVAQYLPKGLVEGAFGSAGGDDGGFSVDGLPYGDDWKGFAPPKWDQTKLRNLSEGNEGNLVRADFVHDPIGWLQRQLFGDEGDDRPSYRPVGPKGTPVERLPEIPDEKEPAPEGWTTRQVQRAKGGWTTVREPVYGAAHNYERPTDEKWSGAAMTKRMAERANDKDLTVDTLLLLSYFVYRDDFGGSEPDTRVPPGWELLAVRNSESGFYAIALYHKASGTVVIVNRGTQFAEIMSDPNAPYKDIVANVRIFKEGVAPDQVKESMQFLDDVEREVLKRGYKNARWFATGQSLGGALAQAEVARAHTTRGREFSRIRAVTFGALGARAVIGNELGTPIDPTFDNRFDPFVVNYTREGDGFTFYDGDGFPSRPQNIGLNIVLRGLHMPSIRAQAGATRWVPGLGQVLMAPGLALDYLENHDARSFQHRDMQRTVDEVFHSRSPHSW